MKKKLILIYCCFSFCVFSQPLTVADSTTQLENYIRFNYENDFFTATDRYYTQGIQLTVVHPFIKYSPLSKTLIRLKNATSNYYGATLEQNCFTPVSIRHEEIFYNERPFTGTFSLAHQLTSLNYNKQIALKTQLEIGGIGKCARCEDEQKAIHRALVNIQPQGWEYQLSNDIILNYKIGVEKGIINTNYFQTIAQTSVRLGSLYSDVSAGLNVRVGLFTNYFKNLGLQKNYINASKLSKYKIYVVVKSNAKAVAYNATLQGGAFNNNNVYTLNANQITRVVYDASAYIVLAYKHFSVEYGYAYTTKEFENGVDHGWGKCTFISNF